MKCSFAMMICASVWGWMSFASVAGADESQADWAGACVQLAQDVVSGTDEMSSYSPKPDSAYALNFAGVSEWQKEVPELLRQVAATGDVQLRSPSGFSALQAACCKGNIALAQALIAAGADVNARPSGWEKMGWPGLAPLGMVMDFRSRLSDEERLQLMRALLEKGADPDGVCLKWIWEKAFREVPFERTFNDEERRLLLKYGNQDLSERMKAWHIYWPKCGAELIRDMLEGGLPPDRHVGEKGYNLMLHLVRLGHHPDLVRLALEKGADVNTSRETRYYFGYYLFNVNVSEQVHPENAVEIVRLLLDAGARLDVLNHKGESLRIHFGRKNTAAARAVGAFLRERGALLHPDAPRHRK